MITVKLYGGLGNQMFQYAAGLRLATHHQTKLAIDLSWFETIGKTADTRRVYELDCFNLSAQPAGFMNKVFGGRSVTIKEKGFRFDPEILSAPANATLDGYWQSYLYFEDAAETIRRDFNFALPPSAPNAAMLNEIAKVTAVSLHVRRGDYITNEAANKFHGTSPLDYYRMAIEYLSARVKNPHFFVFSDDPEWCKANLTIDFATTYVDHNPPDKGYEDLRLMSHCKHHIVANSSFSWWGAWLNSNPEKIVVAPKIWFLDSSIDTTDLVPTSWKRL